MEEVKSMFKKSSASSVEARKSGNRLYAQKNHHENTHKRILSEYSKSVALAPQDSENGELAAAYGNRSALLMHLNEYEKCLLDIDRALEIAKSSELKSKLEARKAKCVEAIKNSSEASNGMENPSVSQNKPVTKREDSSRNRSLNLPTFQPSPSVRYAAEAVAVEHNEKFGRHLVATRYIEPGELIVVEKGYVCFPIVNKRHTICSHCLSFAWNGIPCDHCAFVIYCSETCKLDAWSEYHDVECSLLPLVPLAIFEKEPFFLPYLMLAARLLIKAVKKEGLDAVIDEFCSSANSNAVDGSKDQLCSGTFRSCINLFNHRDANSCLKYGDSTVTSVIESLCHRTDFLRTTGNQIDNIARTTSQLKDILKKLTNIVDDNVFEYQAFVCECDDITDCRITCDATRGIILAPFSSLINHSCNSNVSRMFLPNGKVAMFTVAPVKKGEQLFISYGMLHTQEKEYRQQFLQKYFHFTCKCQACEENWPSDPEQAELDEDVEALIMTKIATDFKTYFPSVSHSSVMNVSEDDWEFDEETLKHAVKLSELTYKHIDNVVLFSYYNDKYKNYISSAFHTLYGEKFAIPDNCL